MQRGSQTESNDQGHRPTLTN